MKKMILIFISFSISAQSQIVDVASIFKMYLYLNSSVNDINWGKLDTTCSKNDTLFKIFNDRIDLKLDTLQIDGEWNLIESSYAERFSYSFYKLNVLTDIKYKGNIYDGLYETLYPCCGNQYPICVIAVQNYTGKSYRIMGFDVSDFLGFVSDFRECYESLTGDKLSIKKILKNYKVQDVDFECLWKGLNDKRYLRSIHPSLNKKYSCLGRISDPLIVY